MYFDGLFFMKEPNNKYHPVVIELDDKTHDLLIKPKYRLNDLAKNIFCQKNNISIIRLNTKDFNSLLFEKILNIIKKSKKAKFVASKFFEKERIEHFKLLSNTFDLINFL